MTAKLSDELKQALARQPGGQPLTVVDDDTHTRYVLVRMELYEQMERTVRGQQARGLTEDELLKQAILNRRDESRQLNEEWEHVDAETWPKDEASSG